MNKIFSTIVFLLVGLTINSQSLGYQDLAQLFSQDDFNGSARFTGMSGAFGAVGGDVSVININPAGIAIFNYSAFSGSFNNRNSSINSIYTGNSEIRENQFFNLSQAGAVLVFKTGQSDWSKFALGANFRITKDFSNAFLASGNGGLATFRDYPNDTNNPKIDFNNTTGQRFDNNYNGEITELNFAISSVYQKRLYLGASINFYELNFLQEALLSEFNDDGNGNILDVDLFQSNITAGTGFSANLGFIYKVTNDFRFGLSYQTPTWYTNIIQDTNYDPASLADSNLSDIGDTTFFFNEDRPFRENNALYFSDYALRVPSKLTASAAYVFGKVGLISVDYSRRYFTGTRLWSNDIFTDNFNPENQFFQTELRNTNNLNIGTEWRFGRLNLRGGYLYQQAADTLALDSDDLRGYSLGAGYDFGNFRIDVAYSNNNRTAAYNFYTQSEFQVESAELNIDNRIFTTSISFHL